MKALFFAMMAICCLMMSCGSHESTCLQTSPEMKVRAKLELQSVANYGDLTIRYIDPMYRVGEKVRLNGTEYKILEMEERPFKHIVYPEEIREVSTEFHQPDLLEAYQHGDTLEIRFARMQPQGLSLVK